MSGQGDEIDTTSRNGHGEPIEEGDRKVAVASHPSNGHGERDDPGEEPLLEAKPGGNGDGEDDLPAPPTDS
jgi:hypothetical protein